MYSQVDSRIPSFTDKMPAYPPVVFAIVFFVLIPAAALFSQTPRIDSLESRLNAPLTVAEKMDALAQLGAALQRYDPNAGLERYRQVSRLAQAEADTAYLINAYNGMGNCYYDLGRLDSAQARWMAALRYVEANRDSMRMGQLYSNIGMLHETRGDLEAAIASYERSLAMIRGESPFHVAIARNNLALVFEKRGDYARAIEYFLLALAGFGNSTWTGWLGIPGYPWR
jgi:tetratricopeptide (TPR) repeat protein